MSLKERKYFMCDFILMTDSTADLPISFYQDNQIRVVPLTYTLNGSTYEQNNGLSSHEFYEQIRMGHMPVTSQINPQTAMEAFKMVSLEGKDILFLSFSSGLSGTYNSCCIAADQLKEEGCKNRIAVLDTLCASTGSGLLLYYVVKMRDDGKSMDEIIEWVEKNKLRFCHVFTVDDLTYLYRGGRVSKTAAALGTMMKLKPVMRVNNEGKLEAIAKVHGRKKSIHALFEQLKNKIDMKSFPEPMIMICQGDCPVEAEGLADLIRKEIPTASVLVSDIGPVIGSHTGPGVIGLFFYGDER